MLSRLELGMFMKIDIYICRNNTSKLLSVRSETDVKSLDILTTLDPDYFILDLFKSGVDLSVSTPRLALDAAAIRAKIADKGYATHGAKITDLEIITDEAQF